MPILKKDWLSGADAPIQRMLVVTGQGVQDVSLPISANVLTDDVPVFAIDEEVPASFVSAEKLTILAGDLTDVAELEKLTSLVRGLKSFRTRTGWLPLTIYVLGHGARFSAKYRYRSPRAEELRSKLWPEFATKLVERPEDVVTVADAKRFMKQRFAELDSLVQTER